MMLRPTSRNQKAKLAADYNELLKELSSPEMTSVGHYRLGGVIGEGTFGKVKLGTHRLTGQRVAVKKIGKKHAPMIAREIHHHRQLRHPNIVSMYEIIVTESSIHVVSEYCPNGELFDALAACGRCPEPRARKWFVQLASALKYCHAQGIVHRDLKLENILLDENENAKICDFGFARQADSRQLLETFCGSLAYSAPEVIERKKYTGPETDIWSLGVILYTLLAGELPFDDDSEIVTQRKIVKGVYDMPYYFSDGSADLIRSMLQKEPSERLSIDQVLAHPWLQAASQDNDDSVEGTASGREDWLAINAPLTRNSSQSDADSVFSGKRALDEEDGCTDISSYASYSSLCEQNAKAAMKSDTRLGTPETAAARFSPQVRYSLGMLRHDDMKRANTASASRPPRFSAPASNNHLHARSPPSSPSSYRSSLPSTLPSSVTSPLCDASPRYDEPPMTASEQHLAAALTAAGVDNDTVKEMRSGTCDSLNGLWTMLLEKSADKYAREGFATVLQQQQQSAPHMPIKLPEKYAINPRPAGNCQPTLSVDASTQTAPGHDTSSSTRTPWRPSTMQPTPQQQQRQQAQKRHHPTNAIGGGSMPNIHSSSSSSSSSRALPEKQTGWFSSAVKSLFVGKTSSASDSGRHQRRSSRTFRNVDAPPPSNGSSRKRYWDDTEQDSNRHSTHHRSLNQKYRLHMLQLSDPPVAELGYNAQSVRQDQACRNYTPSPSVHQHQQRHQQRHSDGPLVPPVARTVVKPDTEILPLMTATPSTTPATSTSTTTQKSAAAGDAMDVDMSEKRYSTVLYRPSIANCGSEDGELVCAPPMAASAFASAPPNHPAKKPTATIAAPPPSSPQRPSQIVTPLSPALSAPSPSSSTSSSTDEDEDLASPVLSLPVSRQQVKKTRVSIPPPPTLSAACRIQVAAGIRRPEFMPRSRLNVYGMSGGSGSGSSGGGSSGHFASKAIIEEEEEEE